MSSTSSMSVPRRSARIAAKAAKAAAVAAKAAPVAPILSIDEIYERIVQERINRTAEVRNPTETLSDVEQIREALLRCERVSSQFERINAATEMFDLLKKAPLWERDAYFRSVVENKITSFLEKQIPTCLKEAFQTNDRPLEWAIYDLKDAVENLKAMMDNVARIAAKAERTRKIALEKETLRQRYYGRLADAVNIVRSELNLTFKSGSKEWYAAFDANPVVQEWQGTFFEMMNASSGY